MTLMELPRPYLLYLGNVKDPILAKTALGIRQWAPELSVGQYGIGGPFDLLDLPFMEPAEAYSQGARAIVIGVASPGGVLGPAWTPQIVHAIEQGLDVISGMHTPLSDNEDIAEAALKHGRKLYDIRKPPKSIPVGSGRKRSGKRVLTIGTDCALGKKYTALAVSSEMARAGMDVNFRATGQTGIIIAGGGLPIDSIVSDFVSGAAEMLSPDAKETHWDVIEGQGSLFHPSFAAVSLGLLHGSQPDVIIACHQSGRVNTYGLGASYPLPSLIETIEVNLLHARRTNAKARCAGISLNTAHLSPAEAEVEMLRVEQETGYPCADPIRGGQRLARLVSAVVEPAAAMSNVTVRATA